MDARSTFRWEPLACVMLLAALGWGGISRADDVTPGTDLASRQAMWMAVAAVAMGVSACIPLSWWHALAYPSLLAAIPPLIFVLGMPPRNGARCWIPVGPFDVQPSELAKLAFILSLARYLSFRDHYQSLARLLPPVVLLAVPIALILKEPDLGTAITFIPVLFAMLLAAGVRWKHFGVVALTAAAFAPVFWAGVNREQKSRIVAWITQVDGGGAPVSDDRWHQHQAKLMIVLGAPLGSDWQGERTRDPDAYRLPAGRTDFVFCLVCERWGLPGALAVALGYLGFCWSGLSVAARCTHPFGRLAAVGVSAQIGFQAAINLGMTTGLLPVVGVTLPWMSYGGSSLVTAAVAVGWILAAGRHPGAAYRREPFRFSAPNLYDRAQRLPRAAA